MTDKPENPQAFPMEKQQQSATGYLDQRGMTLRDYFAGLAMAGLLSNPVHRDRLDDDEGFAGQTFGEANSTISYAHADAMLKERAK